MTAARSYGEACPVAHSLDIIGNRWALLVVRELRLGARRFSDLQANLPQAGPNMLAQRLRDLERHGVVRRRTLPPPAGSKVYELTEWGADLEPVFRALARWGIRAPVPPDGSRLSPDTVMLGIRTFFAARPDARWTASYAIQLGREHYRVEITDGELSHLSRAEPAGPPDATLVFTDHLSLHTLGTGERSLDAVLDAGELTITGDADAARRLIDAVRHSQSSATS